MSGESAFACRMRVRKRRERQKASRQRGISVGFRSTRGCAAIVFIVSAVAECTRLISGRLSEPTQRKLTGKP